MKSIFLSDAAFQVSVFEISNVYLYWFGFCSHFPVFSSHFKGSVECLCVYVCCQLNGNCAASPSTNTTFEFCLQTKWKIVIFTKSIQKHLTYTVESNFKRRRFTKQPCPKRYVGSSRNKVDNLLYFSLTRQRYSG